MAVVVAEGVVEITADGTKIPGQVRKDIEAGSGDAEAAGKSVGKSVFGGVVGAWAAIGGTQAVVGWFSGAVTGASDLNETMSKSATIFGAQAGAIESFGNTAAVNLGLSKEAAIEAAAGFGNMFTQLGFTSEAAAALSTNTVQVAADLGSFNNLPTADVADRISAALRGEYDSLQALIPNINAARVESEAMAASGKTNASELTAQEKAAATLAIVQKDGAAAMGDFAKTADGAANAGKTATAMLEDQQSVLGQQLLPIWQGFLGFLTTTAIPAFAQIVGWLGDNREMLTGVAIALGAAGAAWVVMTGAVAAYNGIMGIMKAVTAAGTVAQWALNVAMNANPVGIVITLLSLLVGAIVWVATQTTFFQDAWKVMSDIVGAIFTWLWESILKPVFDAIGAVFTWLYETIIMPIVNGIMLYIGLWAAVFTWLYDTVIAPIFAAIGAVFQWLWDSVIMPIVGYIQAAIQAWGIVFNWLYANVISPVFAAVAASFQWVWNSVISPIVGFISGAIRTVGDTVSAVFGGIAGFIGSAFQSVLSVIRGPINAIISLVNGAINGLNSLSVTIPAWVPMVGGQTWGLNLPRIPMLARGSMNAPDAFIAGEAGPELITGASGARVYSKTETERLVGGGGGNNVTIESGGAMFRIDEAEDPLGSSGRVARELKKWSAR